MKKHDFLLILLTLLFALILWGGTRILLSGSGLQVQITIDNELYGTYPLSEDADIGLPCGNLLTIYKGQAVMIEADCPDKLCVKMPPICREGQSIICLPHRLVVEVIR